VIRIKNAIYAAIQPFIVARIASSFDAYVERVDKQRIDSRIRIYKGPTPVIDLRYSILWDELQQSQQMSS
jgi:hypothetical protein